MRVIFLTSVFFYCHAIFAQVIGESVVTKEIPVVKVTKDNKETFTGRIVRDDGVHIVLRMGDTVDLYIEKSKIKKVKLDIIDNEMYRKAMPFNTKYFLTNNALPVQKGDNYATFNLYGPELEWAVAKGLSVGVLSSWVASPLGLKIKYAIPLTEKISVGINNVAITSGYLVKGKSWGGMHMASLTFGSATKNITISSGVGYLKLDFDKFNNRGFGNQNFSLLRRNINPKLISVSSIAGTFPIGKKVSFIFDSMIGVLERRNSFALPGWYIVPWNIEDSDSSPLVTRNGTEVTSFVMPGLRFQNTDRSAFQFMTAVFMQYSTIGFDYYPPNTNLLYKKFRILPVPMCSWLIRF